MELVNSFKNGVSQFQVLKNTGQVRACLLTWPMAHRFVTAGTAVLRPPCSFWSSSPSPPAPREAGPLEPPPWKGRRPLGTLRSRQQEALLVVVSQVCWAKAEKPLLVGRPVLLAGSWHQGTGGGRAPSRAQMAAPLHGPGAAAREGPAWLLGQHPSPPPETAAP